MYFLLLRQSLAALGSSAAVRNDIWILCHALFYHLSTFYYIYFTVRIFSRRNFNRKHELVETSVHIGVCVCMLPFKDLLHGLQMLQTEPLDPSSNQHCLRGVFQRSWPAMGDSQPCQRLRFKNASELRGNHQFLTVHKQVCACWSEPKHHGINILN